MKKLKLFLCVALFGAMSFGAFSAYEHLTMSEEERFLLANVEALSTNEPGGGGGGNQFPKNCYNDFENYIVGSDLYHVCGARIDYSYYSCGKVVDNKPKNYSSARCLK